MNRQFRRAQEKQDKRQEKERERRRAERRSKRRRARSSRSKAKPAPKKSSEAETEQTPNAEGSKGAGQAGRKRMPGRFSGVLTLVTVFFITLQGAAPLEEEQMTVGNSLISAGFYLMLGYFGTLWFMRRGVPRAPVMSVIGGVILAASVAVAALIQDRPLDLLLLGLVIPALAIGAYLGRLVFVASPR